LEPSHVESGSKEEPLAYRAVRGGLWVAFGSYFAVGFGFLMTLALTRILSPEHFGVFALGSFFFSVINLRSRLGLGYAFAQRPTTTGELIGTYLTLDVTSGTITLLFAALAVPGLRLLGYTWDVVWTMLVLAGAGLLDALGSTAFVLLERDLHFRQTSILGSAIFVFSYIPALWLALNGGGYWSLLAQNVTTTLLTLIGLWWLARRHLPNVWQLHWRFDRALAKQLLRFGIVAGIGGMLATFVFSFDNFLIGTFVGVTTLGFYDRAYRLAEWPNKLVTGVTTRTAFYTYARLQDDRARLRKTVAMILWLITIITVPLSLILFVTAPDLVDFLYTPEWHASALFLRFLVIYSLVRPLMDNAGSLFVATGVPRRTINVSAIHAVILILIAVPLTLGYGAIGTALGVGISFIVAFGGMWYYLRQIVTLSLRETFATPAAAATVALLAYGVLSLVVNWDALPLPVRLITKAGFISGGFALALYVLQPQQFNERVRYVWRLLRRRESASTGTSETLI
jgi:lipopolysaccharide exporter